MKNTLKPDLEPIKTIDDYKEFRVYITNYIKQQLVNPRIQRKDSLQLILNDLKKYGYIGEGWKFGFLMKLVMYEPRHKKTNIGNWILDLQRFKQQEDSRRINPNLLPFMT